MEERAGVYASRAFVSFYWCHGLAAAFDCGTPWTFHLFPFKILLSSLGCYDV